MSNGLSTKMANNTGMHHRTTSKTLKLVPALAETRATEESSEKKICACECQACASMIMMAMFGVITQAFSAGLGGCKRRRGVAIASDKAGIVAHSNT